MEPGLGAVRVRTAPDISLPADLLPRDGRFGSGPSKIRPEAVTALAASGPTYLGTSHRQEPVRRLVRRVRDGVASLFGAPDGYEVVLGNGGSTAFWDAAAFGLVRDRAQHLEFGEFSAKFAAAVRSAPWLSEPTVIRAAPGTLAYPRAEPDVDLYAWPHNETSTGVMAPVRRVDGADPDALVVVDATSAAGGLDPAQVDVYYFAPQKCFASDGGLWIAVMSPRALARIEQIARRIATFPPSSTSQSPSRTRARIRRTTPRRSRRCSCSPSRSSGCSAMAGSPSPSTGRPTRRAGCTDGRRNPATRRRSLPIRRTDHWSSEPSTSTARSTLPCCCVLRRHGIVDIEPYRKLGRNQLRIGMFPSVDPDDVEALTACVDHIVERLVPA